MRVFVAGGTGAIGRPLVAALLAAGHEVTALARAPSAPRRCAAPASSRSSPTPSTPRRSAQRSWPRGPRSSSTS